jgi:hypothetical protein
LVRSENFAVAVRAASGKGVRSSRSKAYLGLPEQRDHVLGVSFDRERALGNVGGETVALKVRRDDRSGRYERRKGLQSRKTERGRNEHERLAFPLDFVIQREAVDVGWGSTTGDVF